MLYLTLYLLSFLIINGTVSIFTLSVTLTAFERSESLVVYMAFTLMSSILPIFITPLTGQVFDRVRSASFIFLLEGLCLLWLLIVFGQYHWGTERPVVIDIICVSVLAAFLSSRQVTHIAMLPSLVSMQFLPKAHAVSQISAAVVQITVPLIAFNNIFDLTVTDTFHFLLVAVLVSIALGLILSSYSPQQQSVALSPSTTSAEKSPTTKKKSDGYLTLIRTLPSQLKGLLLFNVSINFLLAVFTSLFIPHVLGFSDKESLSYALSVGGVATLLSSLLFTRISLTNINYIFAGGITCGVAIIIAGSTTNLLVIALLSFVLYSGLNAIVITADSVWQFEIRGAVQGRVASLRKTISIATVPIAHAALFGLSYMFSEYTNIDLKSQLAEILVVSGTLIVGLSGYFMLRCKAALSLIKA